MNNNLLFLSSIYQKRRALLALLFLFSLVTGLLFLVLLGDVGPEEHRPPPTDYLALYKPNADYFLNTGRIPVRAGGSEDGSIVPPGYSLILVIPFLIASWLQVSEVSAVIALNVLLFSLSVLLLFLIAERVFAAKTSENSSRTPLVAFIAAILWATYPLYLWFIKNPHTEIPFIFIFFAATLTFLIGLERNKLWIAFWVGVLLGVASLIRPIALFLPLVFAFIAAFGSWGTHWKRKSAFATLLLVAYFGVIAPWMLYVFLETKEFVLLGDHGTATIEAGLTYAIRGHTLPIAVPDDVLHVMEEVKAKEFSTKSDIVAYGLQKLWSDPVPFTKLLLLKAARSWYATAQGWRQEMQLLALQLFYLIPASIGVFYALRTRASRRSPLWLILFLIGFFWLMTFSALSIMRYMMPIMGFVMIFAAIFWNRCISLVWRRFAHNNL